MKSHNAFLVLLPLLFSLAIKVQAQQSNGHLPQCPNTAPQAVIQAVAAPQQGQDHYKRLAVALLAALGTLGAGAGVGAGAGYGIEKAFINEDVGFPGWGMTVGVVVGVAGVVVVVVVVGVIVGVCR